MEAQEKAAHLYLLSWHDALERIDILLSEIRNLQTSIIYVLKQTELYKPLRYEEKYLWCKGENNKQDIQNVEDAIKNSHSISEDAGLARKWVIVYPEPTDTINTWIARQTADQPVDDDKADVKTRIEQQLEQTIARIWTSNAWGRAQRRYYHQLCGLQILKQQVMCDRITLSRHALGCNFSTPGRQPENTRKSAFFLVLRRGVLHRLAEYIDRFRNHQQQFGKSFDSSFQDHPRPYVERRRDMAMYMDFLSDRCRDIRQHMALLLDEYKNFEHPDAKSRLILHGWTHKPQAETHVLHDNVSIENNDIDYVSTHFFTPDRPDLQPSIAHEIAHGIMRARYKNLSSPHGDIDDFSHLLLRMRSLMFHAMQGLSLPHYHEQIDDRLLEIACDLLAAAVKGPSYLYALFLETMGGYCEWLLSAADPVRSKMLDLNLLDDRDDQLFTRYIGKHEIARQADWYYRLHLVARFIKVVHIPSHGLPEDILIDGVRKACDELLDLIMPEASSNQGRLWRHMNKSLCDLLTHAKWTNQVKRWREKHHIDDLDEKACEKGERTLPRSMLRLNKKVREFIFSEQLYMKTKSGKKLYDSVEEEKETEIIISNPGINLYESFKQEYLEKEKKDKSEYACPDMIHRHLYDIPYLCAIMRSQDLRNPVKQDSHNPVKQETSIYVQLQKDMALGRELYQHALEFFIRDIESAHHRLMRIIPLINEAINKYENIEDELATKASLEEWLYGETKCKEIAYVNKNLMDLEKEIKKTEKEKENISKNEIYSWIYKYGALAIGLLFLNKKMSSKFKRKMEKLAGHALSYLYLYDKHWGNTQEARQYLHPLRYYLGLREYPEKKGTPGTKENATDQFYRIMFGSIGRKIEYQGNVEGDKARLKKVSTYLISRLSVLNPPSYFSPLHQGESYKNTLLLKHLITHPATESGNPAGNTSTVLPLIGRYDALVIDRTIPPCFCTLPLFDNDLKKLYRESLDEIKDEKTDKESVPKIAGQKKEKIDEAVVNEKFPVFFGQRESAIAISLYEPENPKLNSTRFFAYIAVTLSHRTFRLDLIYRLLLSQHERNKKYATLDNCAEHHLEYLSGKLKSGDFAFLTDSWEDVIFAFAVDEPEQKPEEGKAPREKSISERLDFIFDFQNALYQDFMVDRTEIMFSPECIDAVHKNQPEETPGEGGTPTNKYKVLHRLRISEDRHLIRSNQSIEKIYAKNVDESDAIKEATLYRTPGRMDFTLEMTLGKSETGESFIKHLMDLDKDQGQSDNNDKDNQILIDKTETSLKKEVFNKKSGS